MKEEERRGKKRKEEEINEGLNNCRQISGHEGMKVRVRRRLIGIKEDKERECERERERDLNFVTVGWDQVAQLFHVNTI